MRTVFAAILLFSAGAMLGAPAAADGKTKIAPSFPVAPPLAGEGPVQQTEAALPPVRVPFQSTKPDPVIAVDNGLRLDAATIGSMTGGVGVGVEQAYLGGGSFFGATGGAVSSNGAAFGTRASGFFARRNAAFSRRISGHRAFSGKRH